MNEMEVREIYRHVDRLSYELLKASERFLEDHRPITNSQARGLANVIDCEEKNINTVLVGYIQHQGNKSTSQDAAFWNELKRELEGVRKQAQAIQQELGVNTAANKAAREQLAFIHLLLARNYVQHLVAHNEYRRAMIGGK